MAVAIDIEQAVDAGHRSAHRLLDILELLSRPPRRQALKDLSAALAAPKSSLLPLLRTLAMRGYILRSEDGFYSLGPKLVELGAGALAGIDLREIARPALAAVTASTGEATMLARLSSDKSTVIHIDEVGSTHALRPAAMLGELAPAYAVAGGRTILAFLSPLDRAAALARMQPQAHTPRTITDKALLETELEQIRETGLCLNIDQYVMGLSGVAAPIRDHRGQVVAAFVLSAPTERLMLRLPVFIQEVTRRRRHFTAAGRERCQRGPTVTASIARPPTN